MAGTIPTDLKTVSRWFESPPGHGARLTSVTRYFYNKYVLKTIHVVCGPGMRTHNLVILSILP